MYNVLVTGVGGIVGQGILRNIRRMKKSIRLIGTDIHEISAGHHLCDEVYQVSYAYETDYIGQIEDICRKNQLHLIIPSTDYEAYYLKVSETEFGCQVFGSDAAIAQMCLDKYENFRQFNSKALPFAETYLPSEYQRQFEDIIIKPRKGRGSRQVFINPSEPEKFSDEYCIQPLLRGKEITTACYVLKNGVFLGQITFVRQLEHGNTVMAEVTHQYDAEIESMVSRILKHFSFRGSFNIQSIVTENGIIPFEINCRISGTNSFRSYFGFNDVAYCIKEYLLGEKPDPPVIKGGTALRMYCDIVYPDAYGKDIIHHPYEIIL